MFLKGLFFGFVLAAIVGPMWVLCFRRTLEHGSAAGLASGLGIAAADAIYGAIAAFGLTAVSGFLLAHAFWIGLAGVAFLVWIGVKALLAAPPDLAGEPNALPARSLTSAFASTLSLTLANPPTILAFTAIFAGAGLAAGTDYGGAALLVAGVFLGSAAWWLILIGAAHALRRRLSPRLLRAINLLSGAVILGFAGWQLSLILR
jgi:threonine/homoserine/homoserine lactone efflux protein